MNQSTSKTTDVLVLGSGIAGLSIALKLATHHQVTLVAKDNLEESSSLYAQGGIAAVLDPLDSIENHLQDTLEAGAGLVDYAIAKLVAEKSAAAIQDLIELGVPFSQAESHHSYPYHLTQEGGHSYRRVIHAADHTGASVINTLIGKVKTHPNITLLPQHFSIDLIKLDDRCIGAYLLNKAKKETITLTASYTVLATGGASKVYLYTSNPDTSTGDGIAMAWRAGCRIANMEFNQFHPTCLYHPKDRSFLISEAVRGEGGILTLPDGTRFMHNYHPKAELAPRDVVARAIDQEMKTNGLKNVYLDISHKSPEFIKEHFPTIYQRLLKQNIDITQQPIPVVPAAHYTCGGIVTDQKGQTDLAGLYAIGETAYTGLHGANRLASNSLLEGLVFAQLAYEDLDQKLKTTPTYIPKPPLPTHQNHPYLLKERVILNHNWNELRRVMWDYVGIVRTDERLKLAQTRITRIQQEIEKLLEKSSIESELIELRNLAQVAELIISSALARKESRGLNYNLDHPYLDDNPLPTYLKPDTL